jgi:dipeptidyl aminopeptidase/acylaminoacyl peptidase
MVYPGGKHGLIRQHDGRHAYATMLGFFDAKLKDGKVGAGTAH